MKGRWIAPAVAALLVILVIIFVVWMFFPMINGLNRAGGTVVEVYELEPWIAPTPDVDLYDDGFYDAPDTEPLDDEPTATPEIMVTVPVIETSEELARDEAP